MNKCISNRLKVLAIWAMLAVIWLHGYPLLNSPNAAKWNYLLQSFLWRHITTWAVPAFFIMSGYFLCWSLRNGYKAFYIKKLHQCLIPYCLWCCYGAIFLIPLKMIDNYRKGYSLLNDTVLESRRIVICINQFFAITYHTTSVNGPLWFLRTLIVFFLLAPLFYDIFYKRIPPCVICLGSILGLVIGTHVPYLCINIDHIAWFVFGIGLWKGHYLEQLEFIKGKRLFCLTLLSTIICEVDPENWTMG